MMSPSGRGEGSGERSGRQRLQVILATAGLGSRRTCEELVRAGRVAVNGDAVTLGASADPDRDTITLDGQPIAARVADVYLALNKPPGYVTTASDELGRPNVLDLLPSFPGRLFPVGRLDRDSEGLLLITSDGELAARLMHPRYGVEREYLAWVRGAPDTLALAQVRNGVVLDGVLCRPRRVTPDESRSTPGLSLFEVILVEGRKREIRRLFASVGHQVERLIRVRYGSVRLGNIAPGAVRSLTADQVGSLRRQTGLAVEVRPRSGPR